MTAAVSYTVWTVLCVLWMNKLCQCKPSNFGDGSLSPNEGIDSAASGSVLDSKWTSLIGSNPGIIRLETSPDEALSGKASRQKRAEKLGKGGTRIDSKTAKSDIISTNLNQTSPKPEEILDSSKSQQNDSTVPGHHVQLGIQVVSDGNKTSQRNRTLLQIFHDTNRSRDVTSATICVSAILVLLFGLILYSRMWEKRDQWLSLNTTLEVQDINNTPPAVHSPKISVKDIIAGKWKLIQAQFNRIQNGKTSSRLFRNGKYKRVHQREDSMDKSLSEDEVYSK